MSSSSPPMKHEPEPKVKRQRESATPPSSTPSDDTKPAKKSAKATARAWSADELDALLTIALTHGASRASFEGKVPGRTGFQCQRTWQVTVVPYLHKCVREKGVKKQ